MAITEILTPTNGGIAFAGIIGVLSLIQVSKIEINPWTWLARKFGNAINHDISEQIKGVEEKANKRMDDFEKAIETLDKILKLEPLTKSYCKTQNTVKKCLTKFYMT